MNKKEKMFTIEIDNGRPKCLVLVKKVFSCVVYLVSNFEFIHTFSNTFHLGKKGKKNIFFFGGGAELLPYLSLLSKMIKIVKFQSLLEHIKS